MPHQIKPVLAERYPLAFATGVADFVLIVVSSFLAFYLRFGHLAMDQWYLLATFSSALTFIIFQIASHCYASWRGQGLLRPIGRLVGAWTSAVAFIFVVLVLLKFGHYYS
ncbi:MAG TPA: hypothetical protein VK031_05430, partial [Tissierellaceae bacterium]|nr:hypothetical protein [Tissierellaceae bacterium]